MSIFRRLSFTAVALPLSIQKISPQNDSAMNTLNLIFSLYRRIIPSPRQTRVEERRRRSLPSIAPYSER